VDEGKGDSVQREDYAPVDGHAQVHGADQTKDSHTVPDVLIVTGLEQTNSTVWIKLVDILRTGRIKGEDGEVVPWKGFLVWIRGERREGPGWLVSLVRVLEAGQVVRVSCVDTMGGTKRGRSEGRTEHSLSCGRREWSCHSSTLYFCACAYRR